MREVEGIKISIIIQVDTLCHKIPNFIDKCARAGVKRVFIGLENINPANLMGAKKRQNKITEYRKMLLAWKQARVLTYAGYIWVFPTTPWNRSCTIIEVIKRELPSTSSSSSISRRCRDRRITRKLYRAGVAMDPDLNKYDLDHLTTGHSRMSPQEWETAYNMAWRTYYTDEHIETIIRRAAAMQANASNALFLATWFSGSIKIEDVHPLESGFFRRRHRLARRPGFPIVPAWQFYPAYFMDSAVKLHRWASLYLGLRRKYLAIKRDPKKLDYMDLALTPVTDEEEERELFHNEAAQAYLTQEHHLDKFRHGVAAE